MLLCTVVCSSVDSGVFVKCLPCFEHYFSSATNKAANVLIFDFVKIGFQLRKKKDDDKSVKHTCFKRSSVG